MMARTMLAAALILGADVAAAEAVAAKKTLTLEGARQALAGVEDAARKAGAAGVAAVVDDGGNLIALTRLDGTFAAGAEIAIGKARTAVQFRKPTKFFEDVVNKGRTAMVTVDFVPLQGGVPVVVDGQVVGGIGVSGAASAAQDEEFALAGAAAVSGSSPLRAVTYLAAPAVEAAFAKGQPLAEVANYKIHASRRDGPGQVEVHEKDTDIIHVLSGTATLVTGGTLAGARVIAPEEVRGTDVTGGEAREIRAGDVIVVPNGTPHWFKSVPAPMTYYVVKVRAEAGR
jgi:glc operon protein GlcG